MRLQLPFYFYLDVSIEGKRVVIVGRSKIVGLPASLMFLHRNATVTVCHSRTSNLKEECLNADILLVAIGRAEMIRGDWIKPGAVVIDCGINVLPGQGSESKNKIVGDVHFESAKMVKKKNIVISFINGLRPV